MITLKTLASATAQEVFDQVATHLLTQNRKSVTSPEKVGDLPLCRYRGPDGRVMERLSLDKPFGC